VNSDSLPPRLGRYRTVRKLGEGGMGVVYEAYDDELERPVAIKTLRETLTDPAAGDRLRREARAAASVSHPNVCQVFEIGAHDSQLFIAMELLEGESLAARLARGPLPVAEATTIALSILAALDPLHKRNMVHRDLKPSNVFLTPHGVKLLDFGLARPIRDADATGSLTGVVMGSPGYMAPEQILGRALDSRTDVFAIGVVLYEMLIGKAPFSGGTVIEAMSAALNDAVPALGGSPAVVAADRVIRRAMSKRPHDRFASAEEMAAALRPVLAGVDSGEVPHAQSMTRLLVLPFRMLRQDADVDFLAFSLADAIASTLSGLGSLVVRSSMSAAAFAAADPDLKRIARDAEVDVVLMGTLLRIGPQLRVHAQLVSAPEGTILWSETPQVALGDLFQLQDDLARRLVSSLSVPLTAREHRQFGRDVPATPRVYELFLRANQHFYHSEDWTIARELYIECLADDPGYAPAWARLGRCWRLTAKFASQSAEELSSSLAKSEEAFRRALNLNPDLPAAHHLYTFLEADLGHAADAVVRLLGQGKMRPNDPEVYAGLVHACRYAGLLDASIAAHQRAQHLDPTVPTSVAHAYWMKGEYQLALDERFGGYTHGYIRALALASGGREEDAIRYLEERERSAGETMARAYVRSLRLLLEGRPEDSVATLTPGCIELNPDPESRFYVARTMARAGAAERALAELQWVVQRGFHCYHALVHDPWLDSLRNRPEFVRILGRAESDLAQASARFSEAGGERFLGI
jgi:serine/threonine protein kinase/tetratricopeptide (TPR) repeat protein